MSKQIAINKVKKNTRCKRKSKKHIKKHNNKHSKKHSKKHKKKYYIGGNNKIKCATCDNITDISDSFAPRVCYQMHMNKAHRICNDCWWKTFAIEGADHSCPGCKKKLPLTTTNNYDSNDVIDLT